MSDERTVLYEWACNGCQVRGAAAIPAYDPSDDVLAAVKLPDAGDAAELLNKLHRDRQAAMVSAVNESHRKLSPACRVEATFDPQLRLGQPHITMLGVLEAG